MNLVPAVPELSDKLPEDAILELIRHASPSKFVQTHDGKLTPRERRLLLALAIILSVNIGVISCAATFFGLLLGP